MLYSKVRVEKVVGEQPGPQDLKLAFLEEGGLVTHLPSITVSVRPGEANDFAVGDELELTLSRPAPSKAEKSKAEKA